MLELACEEVGLDLERLGGHSRRATTDPRQALSEADIVIGYGRSILEAMAYGRAAYVYDWHGGDGWMTADLTGDRGRRHRGSTGRAVVEASRLAEDLSRYDASIGSVITTS